LPQNGFRGTLQIAQNGFSRGTLRTAPTCNSNSHNPIEKNLITIVNDLEYQYHHSMQHQNQLFERTRLEAQYSIEQYKAENNTIPCATSLQAGTREVQCAITAITLGVSSNNMESHVKVIFCWCSWLNKHVI
jgi:phosphomannomutase